MTRLEAINEMLECVGEPPVSALGSSGTWPSKTYNSSDEGQAERILDRECRRILEWQWTFNTLRSYPLGLPTKRFAFAGGSGTFTFDEIVTESTSNATGRYNYEYSGLIYLSPISGTFTGSQNLTGATSGATKTTVTTLTTLTVGRIIIPSTWIQVDPADEEGLSIAHQYDSTLSLWKLTDQAPDDDSLRPGTDQFDNDVTLDVTEDREFTTIPDAIQGFIVKAAAIRFQRFLKRGQVDDAMLQQELLVAKSRAMAFDSDQRNLNVLDTAEGYAFRGGRLRRRSDASTLE